MKEQRKQLHCSSGACIGTISSVVQGSANNVEMAVAGAAASSSRMFGICVLHPVARCACIYDVYVCSVYHESSSATS